MEFLVQRAFDRLQRGRETMSFPTERAAAVFYNEHCVYLPAMLGWFVFSALLSSYNKYVFGSGHMAFPCPLLLTTIHFLIQWVVSHVACQMFPVTLGLERIQRMSWKEWALISIPCGLVTSLDVGLSNLSLVTITITFYTMVKSSTPIFVLAWAYLLGIERITWPLVGVILVIAAGEFLTVAGEVNFVVKGFLLCLTASCLSGARWTLVQLKLQRLDPPLKTTLVTMRLLAPAMFFSLLLISIVVEKPWTKFAVEDQNGKEVLNVVVLGLVGGFFAIAMVLCEFYLILHASAIIMMIGGVIKEMTTIIIGVTVFGDELNATNVAGICVVFLGVFLYKVVFHLQKQARVAEEEAQMDDKEGVKGNLIGANSSDDEGDSNRKDDVNDEDGTYMSSRSFELVGRFSPKNVLLNKMHQVPSDDSLNPAVDDADPLTRELV